MKQAIFAGALCAALIVAAPAAQALTQGGVALNGNVNNGVLIGSNTLGIDAGMNNAGPMTFAFTRTANSASIYDFSSVLENLSGRLWGAVTYRLIGGATFAPVAGTPSGFGSVTRDFGTVLDFAVTPSGSPTSARISFGAQGEPSGLELGNPFATPGLLDWRISLANVAAGNTFSVEIQTSPIPVPGALVLLMSGMVGFVAFARRKRSA
jgi:hypothetical protein